MGPPGGDATPWVFSGTLVVKGHGIAVVLRTGAHTELGRIGTALRSIETEKTPLQREIARIVRVVAVLGIGAAAAVVVIYGLTRGDWLEGLLAGIAAAMSLLPEEFPVVLAVFMALGAWRMSHKHVLTRRAPVIETLGTATVVCVDKTGTLTLNSMRIVELIVDGRRLVVDDGPLPEEYRALVEYGVLASPVHPFDPMDRAFVDLGEELLPGSEREHRDWQLVREYPLSDELLALSHAWCSPDGDQFLVASKGAPEAIAHLCHLDPEQRARADGAGGGGHRGRAAGAGRRARADGRRAARCRPTSTTSSSSSWGWSGCATRFARASPPPSPSARRRACARS